MVGGSREVCLYRFSVVQPPRAEAYFVGVLVSICFVVFVELCVAVMLWLGVLTCVECASSAG